jgi:hypothetical protein
VNDLRAVGHMSRLIVLLPQGKAAFLGLTRVSERENLNEVDVHSDILETWIFAVF